MTCTAVCLYALPHAERRAKHSSCESSSTHSDCTDIQGQILVYSIYLINSRLCTMLLLMWVFTQSKCMTLAQCPTNQERWYFCNTRTDEINMKDSHRTRKADWGNSICSTGTHTHEELCWHTHTHTETDMKHQLLLLKILPTNLLIVTDFSDCYCEKSHFST